jgi:peroxiredoxin
MKNILIFLSLLILLNGCKDHIEMCHSYVGGEIINPTGNKLTIFKSNSIIDTIRLDSNNRFLTKIESTESGFYGFSHGNEYQLILLEPKDSITIRVNTLDFDESLSFSGVGSKKNNYLVSLFTKYENSKSNRSKLYKLDPIEFKKTIDSLQLNEIKQLNKFSSGATTPSKLFKQVALSTVNYIFDSKKEAYRFIDFNNSEKKYPENFYDFRKNIDYNDSLFEEFYQYYNFLFPHFDNLAYEKFIKLYNKRSFTKDNIDYNLIKLELIDSLVANREIKSRLTSFITRKFLSFSKTQDEATLIYNYYLEINKTKDNDSKNYQQKRVINLYNNLKKLKKGNKLPIIELINTSKSSININKLINNKTIIYFWSKNSKNSYKYSHNKVKDLKKNHPDIDFISVNIDKISTEKWLSKLKTNASYCTCIDCKTDVAANEFKLRNVDIAKMLLGIQYIRKTIVVDSNMNIIESNVNLFSDNLDEIID